MEYKLIKFFGIQRSGNHAVLSWLLGLEDDSLFFNFVHPNKAMLDNRHGVSVPEGVKAYCTKNEYGSYVHHKNVESFKDQGGHLICSYENLSIKKIIAKDVDSNIEEFFGKPYERTNILLLRNPFNMMVSSERLLRKVQERQSRSEEWYHKELEKRLRLWIDYAFFYNSIASQEGRWVGVLFDDFVACHKYRDELARKVGSVNFDKNIDFVSNAGEGSSFGQDASKDKQDLLGRWKQSSGDSLRAFMNNPLAIKLAKEIFTNDSVPVDIFRRMNYVVSDYKEA